MAKFRKKPIVIDAALFDGKRVGDITDLDGRKVTAVSCPDWFPVNVKCVWDLVEGKADLREGEVIAHGDSLYIGTLEGVHEVKPGDWILRGVAGELYPCKPDIFTQTYDRVA